MNVERVETHYCRTCSLKVFGKWRGRPHKDTLPLLPKLTGGKCRRCGGTEALSSGDIVWLSPAVEGDEIFSGQWCLGESEEKNQWGSPYFSEMRCPKCQQRSIVSELNLPGATTEYRCNCQLCGVLEIG